ncbi:MAG: hypothetical protein J6B92_06290 [Paraprevotella sp.]|nr:hypothetical protein [Paraprevotella sp.]
MKKTLKFLSWMLVMLLAVTFTTSCSDDDEEEATVPSNVSSNPYAGTTWEYSDILEAGTITKRIRFADEHNAYYEVEARNAGGTIINNSSSPYEYSYSGDFIAFKPLQTGKANLEGRVTNGIRMSLINTSNDEEIGVLYKK